MTTQICGEVIPADKPNSFAMAVRQPVGVAVDHPSDGAAPLSILIRDPVMQQDDDVYPVVAFAEGALTHDGEAIVLRMATLEHGPVNVSLRLADLDKFLSFLLGLAAERGGPAPPKDPTECQPIPISGISAGELSDGMGLLGVTVGGTDLMFAIPSEALSSVAQTLLSVGTPSVGPRLM
jgi:hypothetical protein